MNKTTMASLAIGSALALAPTTTWAQVQPTLSSAPPATAPQTPATTDTAIAAADGDPAQIGDIIVTAERRATSAQKTPISISVVSGGDLARTGTVDLARAVEEVPAVQVQRSNTGASFYIRGIGSRGVGGSSPVSVNEDGIYQQQPDVISAAFTDLDRIEVLRGPQGTLYGRNANGGTINVITRNPVLDEYSSDVTLGFGNYNTIQTMGAVNLPIGSTLAVRLVGDVERHDGYLTNGLSDRNDKVVRGKLLWQPADRFTLLLSAEELFTDSKGPSNVLLSDSVDDPYYAAPYDSFNVVFTGEPVYCSPACRPSYRVRNKQYRAEASYDLGFGVLTGVTGIQRYRRRYLQAFAGGIEYDDQPLDQESYEVRLASEAGSPIQWVAGLYALDQDYSGETKYVYHIDAATIYAINVTRSRAAFGQLTLPLTDRLRLTGGLRYTEDRYRKRVDNGVVDGTTATLTSLTAGTLYTNRYSKATYKGAVEYDLTPRSLVYAQYSTGFRSGGVDERGSVFGPETIRSFEVGSKNRFLGNTLQLNASAYYYRYGGYQLDYAISIGGAATDIITTSNVPGTTQVWGGEVELEYRPGKADRIQASANYQGSRFSDVTLPTSCDRSGACTYTALGGRSLPRTPKWTATLGYEHSFDLPSGGSIVPHVDGQYKSGYDSDLLRFTYSYQRRYVLGNARLIYNLPGERLSISAYVNNFTNKAVVEQANTAGPVDRYGVLNDPRTYGVALTGHF